MKKRFNVLVILFFLCISTYAQTVQEGIKQLENENYNSALTTFKKLSVADPKNAMLQFYIGEVFYAMEDYAQARLAYEKGLSINSKCPHCNIGLGKLSLDEGKLDPAKKYFEMALKGNNKNASIQALVGDAYLYSKKPMAENALIYLSKARDLDPKQAKYWIHLGDAYISKSDNGNAMTSYETAVEKNKNNPETYVKMARIWAASKQLPLAIEKLEMATTLAPDYAIAYKELYELLIRSRKFDQVLPILQKYVSLSGTDVDAKVRLVKFLCFQAKDYERAIEEGTKLLESNPEQYTTYRWLAWSYNETGKHAESLEASRKLFEEIAKDSTRKSFPSDYEYYAKSAAKLGNWDLAESNYMKILETAPERNNEISGLLAKSYFDGKLYEKSLQWYQKKAEGQPLSNTDLYYVGLAQYYSNQYTAADSSFAKVVELTPTYAQGWLMRARVNNNIDPERVTFLAKPYYEKYIELASVDPEKNKKNLIEAYEYIAYFHVSNNDKVQAMIFYEKILALDPVHVDALNAVDVLKKVK